MTTEKRFEWEEYVLITTDGETSDIEEPCINCIGRAMCIHKGWMELLDSCHLIEDYIGVKAKDSDHLYDIEGEIVQIKSMGKIFAVHATKGKKVLLIGRYWVPTINKDGYPEDSTLGVLPKVFKVCNTEPEVEE